MAVFRAVYTGVTSAAKNAYQRILVAHMPVNDFEIAVIPSEQLLPEADLYLLIRTEQFFSTYLCKADQRFHVAFNQQSTGKTWSIYRTNARDDAIDVLGRFAPHSALFALLNDDETLRSLVKAIHEHPNWSTLHYVARIGLVQYFSTIFDPKYLRRQVLEPTLDEGLTPLHLAVDYDREPLVKQLLKYGADPIQTNSNGMNAFHYAARTSKNILELLLENFPKNDQILEAINQRNDAGYNPLYLAVMNGKSQCVEVLLAAGADATKKCHQRSPLAEAMANDIGGSCIKVLIAKCPAVLRELDENDDSPLHLCKNKKTLSMLLDPATHLTIDVHNKEGFTPLQLHLKRDDLGCVVKLWAHGADINCADKKGTFPLHMAVEGSNPVMVKALLVFGANPNAVNADGISVLHMAARNSASSKQEICEILLKAGAKRCPNKLQSCNSFCAFKANSDKEPEPKESAASEFMHFAQKASLQQTRAELEQAKREGRLERFVNLLALDGGGIRGLVLVQILLYIEEALDKDIMKYFSWLAGTSTGAIVATSLTLKRSLRDCQRIYFRLKDQVFTGFTRPYDSSVLENFLKHEVGESTLMSEIDVGKRLIITTVTADKIPVQLYLFRNYELPLTEAENRALRFLDPRDTFVWKALRCSSAAPSYFSTVDEMYVDGGLVANNPTPELLADVDLHNTSLRYLNRENEVLRIGVTLSVGTGRIPDIPMNSRLDLGLPENPFDAVKKAFAFRDLGNLLIEQVTATEGAPVDHSRAWCHMMKVPYFRFSTPLRTNVTMDCKDDRTLVEMCWETFLYMRENQHEVEPMIELLKIFNEE